MSDPIVDDLTKTGERFIFRVDEKQSAVCCFTYSVDFIFSLLCLKIHSKSYNFFLRRWSQNGTSDGKRLHETLTQKRYRASRIKRKQNIEPASRAAADQMGDPVRTKTHFELRGHIFFLKMIQFFGFLVPVS